MKTQFENKINHLEKQKINIDSLREDQKEFIKNNKLILKLQQRFRCEKHNIFIEEFNKIVLSSNDGRSKDLVCKREKIKCKNIIKQYEYVKFLLYYKRRQKRA